jgi:hypothetical protein
MATETASRELTESGDDRSAEVYCLSELSVARLSLPGDTADCNFSSRPNVAPGLGRPGSFIFGELAPQRTVAGGFPRLLVPQHRPCD